MRQRIAFRVWFTWDGIKGFETFFTKRRGDSTDSFKSAMNQFFRLAKKLKCITYEYFNEGSCRIYYGPTVTLIERMD